MRVNEQQSSKIVLLSNAFDSRAKILNIVYFVVFTGFALYMILFFGMFDPDFSNGGTIVGVIIWLTVTGVYVFAGYRFLNKALQTETLVIDNNAIRLSKGGFIKKSAEYDINLVTNFRHLNKAEVTKHPLAGQSFDYLGFQTQQQVINEMHGDNRLAFDYEGSIITFGENIYSWEFEELADLLNQAAGKNITVAGIGDENEAN